MPVPPGPVRVRRRVGPQQLGGLGEFALAPDERRQLGRQVVGPGIERAQRRELVRQAVGVHLDEAFGHAEVAQPVQAEVAQRDAVRQRAVDEGAGRVGGDDLAAVGDGRDPGGPVDVEADQAAADQLGLARVEAHPDADRRVVRPRFGGEAALRGDRRGHALPGAREDDEERVALGALFHAAVGRERVPEDRPMALADLAVALGADALLEAGRALDVA